MNGKSQKFWHGVNDKVTMKGTGGWSMGKNGGVWRVWGIWRSMDGGKIRKFLVVCKVGSSMGNTEGVGKCERRSREMCWSKKKGGGRCGEVCWSVGKVKGDVGGMKYSSHTSTDLPHHPTPQHTSPHLSPYPNTLPHTSLQTSSYLPLHFSTPQHIPPLLLRHFPTPSIFPIFDPTPQTTQNSPIPPPSILLQTLNSPYSISRSPHN